MRLKKWPTWHIVGNSPSILVEDLQELPNTIGVNRILRHPTFVPDYLLLVDEVVLRLERKRVEEYKGKILRYSGLCGGLRKDFKCGEPFDIGERLTANKPYTKPKNPVKSVSTPCNPQNDSNVYGVRLFVVNKATHLLKIKWKNLIVQKPR